MPIQVKIPTMLLKLTNQKSEVTVRKAGTIRELVDQLDKNYPGIKDLMLSPEGKIHHHFIVCINDEDVRYLDELETPISASDRIEIVASIAGGIAVHHGGTEVTELNQT